MLITIFLTLLINKRNRIIAAYLCTRTRKCNDLENEIINALGISVV